MDATDPSTASPIVTVETLKKDAAFAKRCLQMLPDHYMSADTSRITLAYFGLSFLDLLHEYPSQMEETQRTHYIDWIYAHQVQPSSDYPIEYCGFRGSLFTGVPFQPQGSVPKDTYDCGHLAMTYAALLSLLILGDDLKSIHREGIVKGMRALQQSNGSFIPCYSSTESDLRFVYCASAICFILKDWSGFNKEKAFDYIQSCATYDHAFSQSGHGLESHGGSTYCALASLELMEKLNDYFNIHDKQATMEWCLYRLETGFQGRINKIPDTCYSFWIGASLKLLNAYEFVDTHTLFQFMSEARTKYGGFGKFPSHPPDILHSYLGTAGISIAQHASTVAQDILLEPLHPALNLSYKTVEFMKTRSVGWRK